MSAQAGKVSISQAARMYKTSRKTIYRVIEKNNISTEKSADGKETLVQLVDLIVHKGEPQNNGTPDTVGDEHTEIRASTPLSTQGTHLLEYKVSVLEKENQVLHEQIKRDRDDFAKREEKWDTEREKFWKELAVKNLLLEDLREKTEKPEKTKARPTWLYNPIVVYPIAVGGALLFALAIVRFAAGFLLSGLLP